MLLAVDLGSSPFMEGQAKTLLPALAEANVYSFADMARLLENAVCGGLLLGVFFMGLIFWGYAWHQIKDPKKHWSCMAANLLLGGALLAAMALILSFVDLPSSLLPQQYITDWGHYRQEFQEFFTALEVFSGKTGGALEAVAMGNRRGYAEYLCSSIAVFQVCLSVLLLFGEEAISDRRIHEHSRP